MKVPKLLTVLVVMTVLLNTAVADTPPTLASPPNTLTDKDAAGAFVQDFYDWYVPIAFRQKTSLPWETAVTLKSALFSTKLITALRIDKHTFATPDGTYTELEVDPFLNTDSPCEHYVVSEVLEYEKTYRVGVQAICNGKLRAKPVSQAEVIKKGDQWLFTNFHYSDGRNLLLLLKELRQRRRSDME